MLLACTLFLLFLLLFLAIVALFACTSVVLLRLSVTRAESGCQEMLRHLARPSKTLPRLRWISENRHP
jgi:hypothetical protein